MYFVVASMALFTLVVAVLLAVYLVRKESEDGEKQIRAGKKIDEKLHVTPRRVFYARRNTGGEGVPHQICPERPGRDGSGFTSRLCRQGVGM